MSIPEMDMNPEIARKLLEVGEEFRIEGPFFSYEEIKMGNVNHTYKVNYSRDDGTGMAKIKSFLVQRVNTYAFQHPIELMQNIDRVTEHIREKCPNTKSLHFHHTKHGVNYLMDNDGFWRLSNYVPSVTFDTCDDLNVVRSAGEAFGDFQLMLADFDANSLFYTIPDFHNTRKRYEKLKAAQPPQTEGSLAPIQALSSRLGKKTVELQGVTKSFDGKCVLKNFDFLLQRADRVGIVGGNGAGKSTLLNLIAGYITPDSGTVTLGETVKLGYFSQHAQEMNPNLTALQYVKEFGDRIETPEGVLTASKLMENFLFSGPMQHRLISRLSGGEKRRLFLLGILASAPNVLLLDEPTNDLDIPTMTVLENYLQSFPGAIIAVSHDRYFLDKLCNRIFAVEKGGQVRQYPGGYTDYLQSLDIPREKKVKAAPEAPRPKSKKLKFSYKEQREFETIDADIAALESKISENKRQQDIDGADYEKLQALMAEQSQLEAQLEAKEERWMYLTDLAERIAKGEYSEI